MSEEEKKAVEELRMFNPSDVGIRDSKNIDILLNLIKRQQKEIEELKKYTNKLVNCHLRYEELTGIDLLLGGDE